MASISAERPAAAAALSPELRGALGFTGVSFSFCILCAAKVRSLVIEICAFGSETQSLCAHRGEKSVFVRTAHESKKLESRLSQLSAYLGLSADLGKGGSLVISDVLVLEGGFALVEGGSTATNVVVDGASGRTLHTEAHGHRKHAVSTSADGSREVTGNRREHVVVGTDKTELSCPLSTLPGPTPFCVRYLPHR